MSYSNIRNDSSRLKRCLIPWERNRHSKVLPLINRGNKTNISKLFACLDILISCSIIAPFLLGAVQCNTQSLRRSAKTYGL